MKAYGHIKYEQLTCAYGCCGGKALKKLRCRKVVDRSRRKRARSAGKFDAIDNNETFTQEVFY